MATRGARIAITGNTYPVKDRLKELGGRWDADRKAWMVPSDRADAARSLVASAPRQARPAGGFRRRNPDNAPGGRTCPYCGSRSCARAWNPRDLCDED